MGNTKIRNSVKKLFAISFSMILSASALPVLNCSASVTENGAEYGVSVSGEKTYLTLYNVDDTITDLVVPEYIDDKKVEEISLSGNDTLESITLPSSLNKIRFSRCTGLTDINVDTDNECYAIFVPVPAVKISAAVSPHIRPVARITPESIPGIAGGRTILKTVRSFPAPSPKLPSLYESGTDLSASSVVLITSGKIIIARVRAPESIE